MGALGPGFIHKTRRRLDYAGCSDGKKHCAVLKFTLPVGASRHCRHSTASAGRSALPGATGRRESSGIAPGRALLRRQYPDASVVGSGQKQRAGLKNQTGALPIRNPAGISGRVLRLAESRERPVERPAALAAPAASSLKKLAARFPEDT